MISLFFNHIVATTLTAPELRGQAERVFLWLKITAVSSAQNVFLDFRDYVFTFDNFWNYTSTTFNNRNRKT